MSNNTIKHAISTIIALSLSSTATVALAVETNQAPDNQTKPDMSQTMGNIDGMEKCYGISKAGQNDCGTDNHSCAGASKIDNEKSSWIFVPTGTCSKIVGGSNTSLPEKS